MHGYKSTHSAAAPLTFLLIISILGATAAATTVTITATTSANMEYVRVYSAISVSAYINIVYK